MPEIPTFTATTPAAVAQQPRVDIGAASQVADAIARGGAQLEGAVAPWAERQANAKRSVMASDAMVDAQMTLAQSAQQWTRKAGTVDAQGNIVAADDAVNGFNADAQALRQKTLGGIADPLVQEQVAHSFNEAMIGHAEMVRTQGFALEREARIGKLDLQLNGLAQNAASAPLPQQKQQISDTAATAINTMQDAGYMSGVEATTKRVQFTSNVQKVAALQYIRDAGSAMEQGRLTPLALADVISDAKNFPGLLPTERQSLADTAIRLGRTIVSMQTQAQAASDAGAAKALKQVQQGNEIDLLSRIRQGQNVPSLEDIDRLGKSQAISLPGYQAIEAALTKAQKGTNDLGTMNDLYSRMAGGEDVHGDVLAARAGGKLSETTAEELLKGNAARSSKADSAVAKGDFDELKTALGGHAVEQGMLDFTREGARAQAALWAEAQGEWNRRVRINGEDAQQVLPDMLGRYQRAPLTPAAWPQPRMGTPTSSKDGPDSVAAIWQKTKDAAAAGQITQGQLDSETELLDRYRQYWAARDAAAAAAKARAAAPGPKAKLVGISTGADQ